MNAPYPIYKGQNPRHLVEETKAIVNGKKPSLKSPTVYGNQLICIANYYLTKEIIETGANKGKFIDEFIRDYSDNDDDFLQQSAWCAIFMWRIAEDASNLQQCPNKFPNYKVKIGGKQVWGNARRTLEYLGKQVKLESRVKPTPGSMMFRNSKDKNSSGHWGIVTDVDDKTFRTIEGNVMLSNGKEGVGYWEYDLAEAMNFNNGIIFANIQNNNYCGLEVKPFNGYSCAVEPKEEDKPREVVVGLPQCITKLDDGSHRYTDEKGRNFLAIFDKKLSKWFAFDLFDKKWKEITNCQMDYSYDDELAEKEEKKKKAALESAYKPKEDTNTPPEKKVEICRDIVYKIPTKSKLQHYSVLRDINVVSDILDANIGDSRLRNGSALWYNHSTRLDPKTHTGFGMFRDHIGNLIAVLNMNQPQSRMLWEEDMLGIKDIGIENQNFLEVEIDGTIWNGGGWIERFAHQLQDWKFQTVAGVKMPNESALNHVVNWTNLTDKSLFGYLKEIENRNKKLDSPIIIKIKERTKPPSLAGTMAKALSIVKTMTGMVGIPIPTPILKTADSLVAFGSNGGRDAKATLDFLLNATQLAEFYAPETVKGVKDFGNDIVSGLGENVKFASDSLKTLFNDSKTITNRALTDAENILGFDKGEIGKLFSRYSGTAGPNNLSYDLTKLVSNEFDLNSVNKTVENVQNMLMLDQMTRSLKSGSAVQDVLESFNAMEVPIVQDLFASAGSNAAMATFPQIQHFTSSLIKNPTINDLINEERNGENNDILAGLIGQAFGHIPVDKGVFRPLQLAALKSKAATAYRNGMALVLPKSVDPEYKDCFKFILETETDVEIIDCPDDYKYDRQLKKCIPINPKFGVTVSNNNRSGGAVNSGGGSFGAKKKDTKESGGSSSGNGFDFGRDTGWGGGKIDFDFDLLKKTGNPNVGIGKILPPEFIPPCLIKENGKYYYYPYGKPNTKKDDIVSVRTSEKKLQVDPEVISNPTKPVKTDFKALQKIISGKSKPFNNSVNNDKKITIAPTGTKASPLTAMTLLPSDGFIRTANLPTLNDLPEKVQVMKSGNKWVALVNGKVYDFDPINCVIIGYKEPFEEETKKDENVKKIDLENEISRRERERQEAEKKAREERERRRQTEENEERRRKEIEEQRQLDILREQNRQLVERNKKLQTETVKVAKDNSSSEEFQKLIDMVNIERTRANEATKQLNAEKTKAPDTSIFERQLEELRKNNENERKLRQALEQEITLLKNKPVEVINTTPVNNVVTQPVKTNQVQTAVNNEDCTDCDKLGMPKKVVKNETIIYGYPASEQHNCPQCGGCEDECECY